MATAVESEAAGAGRSRGIRGIRGSRGLSCQARFGGGNRLESSQLGWLLGDVTMGFRIVRVSILGRACRDTGPSRSAS